MKKAGSIIRRHFITAEQAQAGFMLVQFTKYLRLLPVEPDI